MTQAVEKDDSSLTENGNVRSSSNEEEEENTQVSLLDRFIINTSFLFEILNFTSSFEK